MSLLKSALALVLLFATSTKVAAFDAKECDVYVFRTQEDALWHCGARLPYEQDLLQQNIWSSLYCDHTVDDPEKWAWAWASDHPDDWCKFMIATVRGENEDHYPLTPEVGVNETPGPNTWFLSTLVDWGCYMVDEQAGVTTAAYLVNSMAGEHASTVTEQCERTINYFDYWNLHDSFRDDKWWGDVPPRCKFSNHWNFSARNFAFLCQLTVFLTFPIFSIHARPFCLGSMSLR